MTVSQADEYEFLKLAAADSSKLHNKIIFVNGNDSNYIMVNGVKYAECSTNNVPKVVESVEDLQAAIENMTEGTLKITKNLALIDRLTIPAGKDVEFDFAPGTSFTTTADYGFVVEEGATLTISGNAEFTSTKRLFANKGTLDIVDGTFDANIVISNTDGAETNIYGGEFTSQECVANAACKNSTINIYGGEFTAKDNAVIMDNGTAGFTGNVINIAGGTFNCGIESNGYIACGVYVANDNEVNLLGGTFNVTDGCGVLARAGVTTIDGATFNCTGNSITGKVGDGRTVCECVPVIFDEAAKYPGLNNDSQIIIKKMKTAEQPSDVFDEYLNQYVKYCYLTGDKTNPDHLHNVQATSQSRINLK